MNVQARWPPAPRINLRCLESSTVRIGGGRVRRGSARQELGRDANVVEAEHRGGQTFRDDFAREGCLRLSAMTESIAQVAKPVQ